MNTFLLRRASPRFLQSVSRSLAVQTHSPSPRSFVRSQASVATATQDVSKVEPPSGPVETPSGPIETPSGAGQLPFTSLKDSLSSSTLEALTVRPLRLTHMTAVQQEVLSLLPQLAEPYGPESGTRDLLVKARTGTGKTIAFLVPAIEARRKAIQAAGRQAVIDAGLMTDRHLEMRAQKKYQRETVGTLILSPTRELATQIANDAIRLTGQHGMEVRLFTGGMNKRTQMRDWMKGSRDIVVATTGRLRDLLESEPDVKQGITTTSVLILDEADTMLDMGFRDDIEAIKAILRPSPERQTFLFSATVSPSIRQVARSILSKDHKFIDCIPHESSPVHAHIPQYHTVLPSASQQIPHIMRLIAHDQLSNPKGSKVIVFLPTTRMTQLFATVLQNLAPQLLPAGKETKVFEIHSKRTMEARMNTSARFRSEKSGASILITSDVSARGVDYPGVSRVIQVGIPSSTEQYVHRIGRTGRARTSGRGDIVLLPWEIGFISWQLTDVPLKPLTVSELQSQLKELAETYDQNSPPKDGTRKRNHPYSPLLTDFETTTTQLTGQFEPEAIRETFLSLIGYYFAKTPELRVQKNVVLEGLKSWTTEAMGQAVPPFVSERFLTQLGFSDGRTKHYGRPREDRVVGRSSSAHWLGRGKQMNKGTVHRADDVDYRDPEVREYRGQRYGVKPRWTSSNESRNNDSSYGGRPKQQWDANRQSSDRPRRQWDDNGARQSSDRPRRQWGDDSSSRRQFGDKPRWESRSDGGDRAKKQWRPRGDSSEGGY